MIWLDNTNNNIIYNKLHTEQEVDEKKQGGQYTDMWWHVISLYKVWASKS